MTLIDNDELRNRLAVLVQPCGGIAVMFAIDELGAHMRYLDIAVEDDEAARAELRDVLAVHAGLIGALDDLAKAHDVLTKSGQNDRLRAAGVRFHYRLDSAYGQARRVLDRVVVVANRLLPRTGTDMGKSHNRFGRRLVSRCKELGLTVPPDLLLRIDDLHSRIKDVRDELEHAARRPSSRLTKVREDGLVVESREAVRVGEEARVVRFEPAAVLREEVHDYVQAVVGLLESGARGGA